MRISYAHTKPLSRCVPIRAIPKPEGRHDQRHGTRRLGLDTHDELLPRSDAETAASVAEEQVPYELEQDRVQMLTKRTIRDRIFRTRVLKAYDRRCAFTGFQFINGGGRAEVEAAHIKSVQDKGPNVVQNGLAL